MRVLTLYAEDKGPVWTCWGNKGNTTKDPNDTHSSDLESLESPDLKNKKSVKSKTGIKLKLKDIPEFDSPCTP